MRTISLIALFFFISVDGFSQNLEGKWHGHFSSNYSKIPNAIAIDFVLQADSSFKVYSSLESPEGLIVCEMIYDLSRKNNLYLEEVELIRPRKSLYSNFQKMYLTITVTGKGMFMEGRWKSVDEKRNYYGKISLKRKT